MKYAKLLPLLALYVLNGSSQESPATSATGARASEPQASLAQLMQGLLYPNSEIIFATQSEDPEEAAAAASASAGPFDSEVLYTGWEGVENAALVLSEAAALIMVPGRLCENGLPVPLGNEDFRRYADGLIEAGQAAYDAAKTKRMDAMIEASGVVSDACYFCHEVYRDRAEGEMRCVRD